MVFIACCWALFVIVVRIAPQQPEPDMFVTTGVICVNIWLAAAAVKK